MEQQSTSYFSIFRESLDNLDRPIRVVMFADIVGSTQMKSQGVVAWLPTVGKFYDIFSAHVTAHGGRVVKFLGDGALAEFSDDEAEAAINAAIRIQEALKEARDNTQFMCQCSVGITTGRPVAFAGPGGEDDLIGSEVDKAARLCGAAESGAIWVDPATIAAANMAKVRSKVGVALGRQADEYHSGEETIQLKGFREPVRYREIIWDRHGFGVRSAAVSDIVAARAPSPTTPPERVNDQERNWQVGEVAHWDATRGVGFIRTREAGRDRFVNRAALVDGSDLTVGDRVAYLPRPALRDGRNDIAVCVLRVGSRYKCTVIGLPPGRDFGFATVHDHNANRGRLFVPLPAGSAHGLIMDERAEFVIAEGRSGVIAELPPADVLAA